MEKKEIHFWLKLDFDENICKIAENLIKRKVYEPAISIFLKESQLVFAEKITDRFNKENLKNIFLDIEMENYVLFHSTSEYIDPEHKPLNIENYDIEDLKQIVLKKTTEILIKYFRDFVYLSPENKYFILTELSENIS